jgi:hypothetical protein
VYVHRAGRTARANQTGTSVSLVCPEDAGHHRAICAYLGSKALSLLQVDPYCLPMLRQRVALAKKVGAQPQRRAFVCLFVDTCVFCFVLFCFVVFVYLSEYDFKFLCFLIVVFKSPYCRFLCKVLWLRN